MEIFLNYLKVFAVGGFICMLAQILIIYTKITSGRILVLFVCIGALMEGLGIFKPLQDFAGSGATVPIIGFGMLLARGAIEGAKNKDLLAVLSGPLEAAAAGLTAAIIGAFIVSLVFKSHSKN